MLEFNEKQYELKYNLKRIEMIENSTGTPMMAELRNNGGMLSISHLKTYVAMALKEQGADVFVKTKAGMEIAEALIENAGYVEVNGAVLEALERDCPFFFR